MRLSALAAALSLTLAVLPARADGPLPTGPQWRECGTPEPTLQDLAIGARLAAAAGPARSELASAGVFTVHVAFHVISNGAVGDVAQARIDAQIAQLNADDAPSGIRFVLDSVDRTSDSRWFNMTQGSSAERSAKSALAIDPLHKLNVYTFGASGSVLGWAYLPWTYPENDTRHGIVIRWDTLPGVAPGPFDMGRTLTHESGHYFGLLHTFQGGCADPGDEVDDTPFEAVAAHGCPSPTTDSCPQPGLDPVWDFMDYSDDSCMTAFTIGQSARMQSAIAQYRPHLVTAVTAVAPPAPGARMRLRAPYPSPARGAASCTLSLPQAAEVRVALYGVAGQRIATVAERVFAAGETRLALPLEGLQPGTYFVRASSVLGDASAAVVVLR